MKPLIPHTGLLVFLIALQTAAHAGLEWDKTEQSIDAKLGEAQVSADYHFKNTGTSTLRVLKVQSSCGCTVAGVDKEEIKPGEAGTMTAVFQIGERVGQQEKVIMLTTDDANQPETSVKLRVNILEVLHVSNLTAGWSGDAPYASKSIAVTLPDGVTPTALTAQSSSPQFEVKVEGPDPKTRAYSLVITPGKVTKKPTWAVITLRARISPEVEKTRSVYVAVK